MFNLTEVVCRNDKGQNENIVYFVMSLSTSMTFVGKVDIQRVFWYICSKTDLGSKLQGCVITALFIIYENET